MTGVKTASRVLGSALMMSACSHSPSAPTPPPSPPSFTAIRVSGPATIAPGATGEFTAIADRADGSSVDVTATVWWSITGGPPSVLRLIRAGTVQAGTPGEAHVNAQILGCPCNQKSPGLGVLVLEPGTFRVSGTVTSSGARPEVAATVEIVSGVGTGLGTKSDSQGHYALYGVAGEVALRASRVNFDDQVHRSVITDNTTDDFDLTPIVTPADLSGSWTLTLSASPSCGATLPQAARERTFDATITQQGTYLNMTVTGPTITPAFSDGRIFGQALSLIFYCDTSFAGYCVPDLLERLSPVLWLGLDGVAQGTATGSEISGTLDGNFDMGETSPPYDSPRYPPKALCKAPNHGMVLRRK